jgi:hypothetical protein
VLKPPQISTRGWHHPTVTIERWKLRIGPTSEVKRLSWTRESRNRSFHRAISGQSAASATHLPCQEGSTFPHPAGDTGLSRSLGLLRCGAQVTARFLPHPTPPGIPERAGSRISTVGDAERR